MARHRTRVRVSRSLRAVATAAAAAGTVTAVFEADIGRSVLLAPSTVALMPPVVYLALAFVMLRGVPLGRRLGWALAGCGVNVILALVSGVTLSLAHPMSLEGAMRRTLWAFAPGPLVHLVAAPLVLFAWRSRLMPLRTFSRPRSRAVPLESRAAAPAPATSTPDWDSVLRVPSPTTWRASRSAVVFDRIARETESEPAPAPAPVPRRRNTPAAAVVTATTEVAVAPPMIAMSPPAAMPAPAKQTPQVAPPVAAPSPRVTRAPAPPAVKAPPIVAPPAVAPPALEPLAVEPLTMPDEPVVRVPFDRIADQLPPDVFVLPPARLAESVREPHVIVIPSRLVLPQLGEGAVEVPWTLIEDQFPELALAMPKSEVRRRFPGWVLSLPMDVVVRQLPSEMFRAQAPGPELLDLGQFPAPFNPQAPEPEAAPEHERMAATTMSSPPVPPSLAVESAATPVADEEIPAVVFAFTEPTPEPLAPASAASSVPVAATPAPLPVAEDEPAPVVAPSPVVLPPPVVTPSPVVLARPVVAPPPVVPAPPAPRATTVPPASPAIDEEAEALGRTLALGLAPLGAFDWQARRAGSRPLVSFVSPALSRHPIDALVVAAAPLVARLASWGIEQVTIRTTRVVCVLTPLGGRGCLAATVRRGGPVAMLEMLSARAGHAAGETPGAASPAIAFPAVATAPAMNGNGHRLAEAARALAAFGPLAVSVAEADGAAPGVYVFGGRDQQVLAGVARAVHEALVARHDQEALGRFESVVLQRGRERAVVRPLRGPGGQPAVLAAAGEVTLAGRAHRAAAEAAAVLEAR